MQKALAVLVAASCALGFSFAAVSTADFVAHLDRQVHGIHCSFLPGVEPPDLSGSSGCHVTLMSPYSSVLRDRIWGGIPISLPAMGVFAYLAFFALALLVARRTEDRRASGFLLLGTALPLATSAVMGWIAFSELGAACKLCIGIYVSSALAFAFALALFLRTRPQFPSHLAERLGPAPRYAARSRASATDVDPIDLGAAQTAPADATLRDDDRRALGTADTIEDPARGRRLATASEMDRRLGRARPRMGPTGPIGAGTLAGAFALGVACVLLPVLAYAAGAPDFERYLGACGTLARPDDPHRVLVPLGPQSAPVDVIEVLDPLCPACRGFERRFAALPDAARVRRRALLFPLDDACNWMVDRPVHPGACAISEAILCADDDAEEVLRWAFDAQDALRAAAARDPGAPARMVVDRFPRLRGCVGSPAARDRLNRSLRWAVANALPVLTPQVYVAGTRICDADTDLGLDWTLRRLLERSGETAPRRGSP